jgi:FKBP-type peptidyl-prolyl cis-trans isomerase FklB
MRFTAVAVFSVFVTMSSPLVAQQEQQLQNPTQNSQASDSGDRDAGSYGIGYDIGMNLSGGGITTEDIKPEDLIAGMLDALAGEDPAIEEDLVRAAMQKLGEKISARKKASAGKFLEENKKKEGVQVTDSGLQYKVLKSGNGATPTADSTVSVHYEGTLPNGEVFDSSIERGQPATFGVSQVIPGWTEALMRMKVGDKWQLVIPPELAYGERGSPPRIGPNETLVFEVELLEIQ